MKYKPFSTVLLFLIPLFLSDGLAQESTTPQPTLEEIQSQLDTLKADYERRIQELEAQLELLKIQVAAEPAPAPVAPAAPVQSTPGLLNPAISVIGNFLGRYDDDEVFNEEGDRIDKKMNLREAELDMRVPVDPYADGVLIAAFESEFPGEFEVAIEEGYVNIKKLPFLAESPLGLKLKAGRFRPAFGKMNILHTHDLPSSFRPLPIEEFLGEEGFVQNGVSGNFFLPTPWDAESSLDATIEIIDGGDIAISADPAARIAYLGHLRWFRTFADIHNLELGWSSYFHPSGNGLAQAQLHGVDFMYRWKPLRMGEWKSYLVGAEWMFAPDINTVEDDTGGGQEQPEFTAGTAAGFTAFSQWQFNRRTYAGVRFDYTDSLLNNDLHRQSITPYVSYYFSEFLRFRMNYEHRWSDFEDEDGRNSLFFELNWIFGAHPPEPFWVNK